MPKTLPNTFIFSIPKYDYLGEELCKALSARPGLIEYQLFPDLERCLRIRSSVRNQDVVLVGGTIDDSSTLDLYDIASGLVSAGCRQLTMLIPFLGYSTMERAVKPGEIVIAKTRAHLFSSLPSPPFGIKMILVDLHAEGIPYYFDQKVCSIHLYAKELILREAAIMGGKSFTLASVDAGRAKWVESLANDLGVPAAFIYKRRVSATETEVIGVSASVKGQKVIIYDDMIRTGGSLIEAAKAYSDAGAKEIQVIATHGLFTKNALKKLRDSGIIQKIVCTNTHPNVYRQITSKKFLKMVSIGPLLSDFLRTNG